MNTVYRVVWSTELGQWVVASEFAKGRKKKSASGTKAVVAVGGLAMLTAGGSAFAASGTSGYLDVCGTVAKQDGKFGTSYQSTGTANLVDCDGKATYFDLSAGGPTGGARINGRGDDLSLSGSTITVNSNLTMADHRIVGLAPGIDGTDAVNMNQLNAVTNDSLKWDSAKAAFSAAHGGVSTNKITDVADGTLAAGSKDAVNGGQLNTTNQNVTNLTTNLTQGKIGLVQQASSGANITVGKDTNGTAVDFKGTAGERRLINVADGTVAANSKDAVNGGQLFTTNQNLTTLTTNITEGKIGLVQQASAGANITVGKGTDGTAVDFKGTAGDRKLINVADGTVAAGSKEAVNGGQLFNVAGDTSSTYITNNGAGVKYARTNDTGLAADDAHASAAGATAVGYNAKASTADALALGRASQAAGISTVAAGGNAKASGLQGSAVGYNAQATSANTSALGFDAQATGSSSTALGASSRATATQSIAIGQAAQATKDRAAAIGRNSKATNTDSTAIGDSVTASGVSSSAFGSSALAQADFSVAIGNGAQATAVNSVALGTASTTTTDLTAAAYKPNASSTLGGATAKGEVSMGFANGERRVTNVAAGSADTDAVNVSQLKSLESKVGSGSGTDAMAVHYDATPTDKSKVSLAGPASSDGGKTGGTTLTNVHQGAVTATSTDAINGAQMYAITGNPSDQQPTIPDPSNPSGPPIANPNYKGKGTRYFKANGKADDSDDASATGTNAVAMGANAKATAANSVALGAGSTTTANNAAAAYNAYTTTLAGATSKGEVSVGSAGNERRITNLAAGASDSDAVNVSQLKSLNNKVDTIASSGSFDANALHYDATPTDKSKVSLAGPASSDGGKTGGTTLTNVHQGAVTATSTDAINGAQMYAITGNPSDQQPTIPDPSNPSGPPIANPNYKGKGIRYFKANGKADDSDDASATGTNAVAMGANAKATAANSVALGAGSTTTANNAAAAYNPYTTTLAGATSKGEVSVGSAGNERRITNLAAGASDTDAVNVSQLKSLNNKVENITTPASSKYFKVVSVSNEAQATAGESLALGGNTAARATNSTAIGSNASVDATNSTAIGFNAGITSTTATNAVALGAGSRADAADTVSVGRKDVFQRRITNVGTGIDGTDAVNKAQMDKAIADAKKAGSTRLMAVTPQAAAGAATDYVKVSSNVTAGQATNAGTGTDTMAIGPGASAIGNNSVAVGTGATLGLNNSTAIGYISGGSSANITTVGYSANATAGSDNATVIGFDATVDGAKDGVAIGSKATAEIGDGAVAIGANAKSSKANSVALGSDAITSGDMTKTAYAPTGTAAGVVKGLTPYGQVSVGAVGKERRVTNVAAAAEDTDAVNLSQLKAVEAKVASGSGSGTDAMAVHYDATPTDKSKVTLAGPASSDGGKTGGTTLTNVHQGAVTATSTDAINGAQMYAITGNPSDQQPTIPDPSNPSGPPIANPNYKGKGIRYFKANGKADDSDDAVATGANAVAMGANAKATAANSVALGAGSTTMANNAAAAYNPYTTTLAGATSKGEVSVGSAGNERRITNLAAGASDSDAVNVSQLKSLNNKVDTIASSGSFDANALHYDATPTDKSKVTLAGPASSDGGKTGGTTLTNVHQGAVTATSTDAINGAQMYAITGNPSDQQPTIPDPANPSGPPIANPNYKGKGIRYFKANGKADDSDDASATGTNAVAMGANAKATAANSVALGAGSTTTANNAAAAYNANASFTLAGATSKGEVSVGSAGNERRITNLAAGSADTDAVNVSQLKSTSGKLDSLSTSAVQYDATPTDKSKVTLAGPASSDGGKTGGTTLTNVHQGAVTATSTDAINGAQMYAITGNPSDQQPTIPDPANPSGPPIANPNYKGKGIRYFKANGKADDSDDASATGTNAVAMGANAKATAANSVALGAGSTTTANNAAAAYNPYTTTLAGATSKGEVSVGSAGNERRITNLAAGSADTDAVNVSQLKSLESKVGSGGSGTDAMAVHYDATPTDKSKVSLAGPASSDGGKTGGTTLTNVHQGAVTATSTDAINGAQMYAITGNPSDQQPTIPDPSNPSGPPIANPNYKGKGIRYFKANGKADDSDDASATGTNAVAMGANAKATTDNSVALGAGATTNESTANLATAGWLPTGSTNTLQGAKAIGEVSVGSAGKERRVTNVAAGRVGTDAVNLSQLQAVDAKIANSGGGGGGGIDTGAVRYDGADKTIVSLQGPGSSDGGKTGGTTMTGLHQGNIAAGSTDAINGSQVYALTGNPVQQDPNNPGYKGKGIRYFKANGKADDTDDAVATGTKAVAMGANAKATAANSVALGADSTTIADLTKVAYVAKGASPSTVAGATAVGEVSLGSAGKERRMTNLAAGASDTDAVNVSQLKSVDSKFKVAGITDSNGSVLDVVTYDAGTNKGKLTMAGPTATDGGKSGGTTITNVHQGAVTATSTDAINGAQMYAITGNPTDQQPTIPDPANPSGPPIANPNYKGKGIRYFKANGKADDSDDAVATGANAVAMGANAKATTDNSVALGAGSTTTADLTKVAYVAKDANPSTVAGATAVGEVSVGSAGKERRMTNLAAGASDTDAVNVSQLKAVDSKFTVAGITDSNGSVLDVVTYDAGTNKGKITMAGPTATDGGKSGGTTITNVHQGAVTATSTDAINGAQMYAITGNPTDQQPTIPDPSNPSGPPIANPNYKGKGIRYFKANGKADDSDDAVATGANAVAMGANAKATTDNSVALGAGSTTTADLTKAAYVAKDANPSTVAGATAVGEVSVGSAGKERRITNLAAGASDTDAVNVSQLKSVDSKFKVAGITDSNGSVLDVVTYDAGTNKGKLTMAGPTATDGGKSGGTTITNVHQGAVTATSTDAINGAQMYAITGNPTDQQPTIPDPANPSGPPIANPNYKGKGIRYFKANGKADDSDDAVATGANAVAMGANAKATTDNSVALGAGSTTTADLTKAAYVAKDANPSTVAGAAAVGEVSLGSAGKERRITNLAAGASDTDAVNVSQLKSVDSKFKVSGLTDDQGNVQEAVVYKPGTNRAEVNFAGANGTLLTNVAPGRIAKDSKEAVNGGQIADLRDSLQGQITNIDNRVTKIENNGGGKAPFIAANGSPTPANADAGTSPGVAVGYNSNASGDQASAFGDSAVASGSNSVALGNGSVADRANSVSMGSQGHERAITNVADGTAPTDAVNMRVMQAGDAATLKSANDYTDSQIDDVWQNLGGEIDQVNRQANRGIAAASALINVTPYLPGHTAVNAGVASYRGEVAPGIGVSRWSENGRVNFNAGVSAAKGDDAVFRVGVGYVF